MLQQENMCELFRGPQELVGDDGRYDYIITNSIHLCSSLFTFLAHSGGGLTVNAYIKSTYLKPFFMLI